MLGRACGLAPAAGRLAAGAAGLDEPLRLQQPPRRVVDVREARRAQQHAAKPVAWLPRVGARRP